MKIPLLAPDNVHELELRVAKVRARMETHHADAMLVASSPNIFYLSGCEFYGYIYVSLTADPVFFVIRPAEVNNSHHVCYIRKPEQITEKLRERGLPMPECVGLEYADLFYNDIIRLQNAFADAKFTDGSVIMRGARITKTPYELELMKIDGIRQATVYQQIRKCWREDMTDVELQIEIERVLRREGCLGILRTAGNRMELNMGSLIAGDNADAPSPYDFSMGGSGTDPSLPVGANGTIIRPGMSVMVDMNGCFNGYQTDMTRTWILGEVPALAHRAHECSVRILERLEKIAVPGVPASELYLEAMHMVEHAGLQDYFMGHHQKASFIGHGVGIELNEAPVLTSRNHAPLEENMTIAIEPKFVIPGTGAVGIENTYCVSADGLHNLTVFATNLQEL